jgi:cbb3-type cytochrome oxidase subunit 1
VEPIIVWYLRMSVVYFVLGALFGVSMIVWPEESGYYISTHVHLNLLGFMSMMIYGVGYHILPRFSGKHIFSPSLVRLQFWFANAGLVGMTMSWAFIVRESFIPFFQPLLVVSAVLSFIAVFMFAVNILKTIKPA